MHPQKYAICVKQPEGINNLKEWHNNHQGRAEVIIVIPELFIPQKNP